MYSIIYDEVICLSLLWASAYTWAIPAMAGMGHMCHVLQRTPDHASLWLSGFSSNYSQETSTAAFVYILAKKPIYTCWIIPYLSYFRSE